MRLTLLAIAFSLVVAGTADAQQLKLAFNQGHVSIDATSVPIRTILAEWSKLGGTKVTGAERVAGAPLTLKLVDVPESKALEIILRSVAGYMAAPRVSSIGPSMYDRILVMATSSAPAASGPARPTTAGPGSTAGTQRFVPPRPVIQQPADDDDPPEEEPERPNQPVFTFPQVGQNGFPQPGTSGPQGVVMPPGTAAPGNTPTITINPAPPTRGFGPIGSPTPGMIQQPAPQPGQQAQPGPMVRPPGA